MKVIMIDSLVGNDYSNSLCSKLVELGWDVTLIVTEDRIFSKPVNFEIKKWAPTKESNQSKFNKLFLYIKYLAKLSIYLRKSHPGVVHFQFFRREKSESLFYFLLKLIGIRLIYTTHDIMPLKKGKIDYFFNNVVYKSSTALVVHSAFLKIELIKKFNIKKEKIFIVPHGDFDIYLPDKPISKSTARAYLGLNRSDHVMLFFGFIKRYKGLDLLLKAFEIAAASDKNLKLVIAGRPETPELESFYSQIISESAFQDRIIFSANFIEPENIPHYFTAADVIVLPYKNIYHSGLLHLAFSFGKPVIATKVGDFPETIENGKCGFLLEYNNEQNLSSTIKRAFSNKWGLKRMGKYARFLSETKYSWHISAKETGKIYNHIARLD